MLKSPLSLIACALAALTAVGANHATAQDSRWFLVELLVFANETPDPAPEGAATPELWDPTPELAYPGAARFLIDPEAVAANIAAHPASSEIDEFGRQILTLEPEEIPAPPPLPGKLTPVYTPGAELNPEPEPEPETEPEPVAVETLTDAPAAMAAEEDDAPALPRPFVILPPAQREFRGKAALMERSGRYRTLFHQSWLQPVPEEDASLPIVLDDSGNTGQWPRLQGSIKLYLTRYLHLETNLWLNTDGHYLPGNWQMPAPPLGPPSLIIEEPPPPGLAAPAAEVPLLPAQAPGEAPEPRDAPGIAGATEATDAADVTEVVEVADSVTADQAPGDEADEAELPETESPVYPFRHALLLQQQRRMRSGELHYVDHPRFGLVIRLTPVTGEELAEYARAQADTEAVLQGGAAQLP